jgi:polyphenol oxidase
MISSFFINVLNQQPLLIHGTSPRFYVHNGERKPFLHYEKGSGGLFLEHQKIFLHSLGIGNKNVFRLTQVHGNHVYVLKDPGISVSKVGQFEADAIITNATECPLVVLTADCVPIFIYDPIKHAAGVVHAGRLGTQKRVLTNAIEALSREYGSHPTDLIVGMGPAIRGCCYEVDESCVLPFIKNKSLGLEFINKTEKNTFFIDLPKINQLEVCEAGVLMENIYNDGPCTACENHRWYSYRKEGKTGRLITLIMLKSRE